MLKELLSLFRTDDPLAAMAEEFGTMLRNSRELTEQAGRIFFDEAPGGEEEQKEISKRDVAINKLERQIRKQVITHLTLVPNTRDAAYCLLLMSIVKDVERIGDYAKNLAEVRHDGGGPVPDDELGDELRELRRVVEAMMNDARDAFSRSDPKSAMQLITLGRTVNRRCDTLIAEAARSDHDAATTTTLVLGARYYKRIAAHLINVLSGVVMPLHKLDYFDEDVLDRLDEEDGPNG